MSRGAATEAALGALHTKIAAVFTKVLERYETRMDALDIAASGELTADSLTEEVLADLLNDGVLPNPAMLSAITKFLKDNEINFDSQQIEELSSQERRLADRLRSRPKLVDLSKLSATA